MRARRDALQPEDVGLRREPGRRVPGLRREEVARLAGVSPEYYLRLEQGRDHQPSEQVLAALSRALLLDAAAGDYLHRLAHPFRRRAVVPGQRRAPGGELEAVVRTVRGTPAIVTDPTKEIVAGNDLALAMAAGRLDPGRNVVLDVFDPRVKAGLPGWEALARRMVAALRLTADPHDTRLQEVVGRLSVRDEDFRRWWVAHEVVCATSGTVPMAVDEVGVVLMHWRDLNVPDWEGHVLTVFTPADERAEQALDVVSARAASRRAAAGRGRAVSRA
nr:helix-turn-helix transcriptional regulator [Kineococcus vitellinus]